VKALHEVRAVALTDYSTIASSVGLDPLAMLEAAGLTAAMLADPETRLPATAVAGLLEQSALAAGCEDFALRIARCRTYESLGGVAPILERLGCIREIIATTMKLRRQLNDVFSLDIVEHASPCLIVVHVLPQFGTTQARILTVAVTHILLRGATRGGWTPLAVHFRHRAPTDRSEFERFFRAPLHFSSRFDGFECTPETLDRPYGGNPLVAAADIALMIQAQLDRASPGTVPPEIAKELEDLLKEIRTEIGKITDGGK
jgi:hypothetical protein